MKVINKPKHPIASSSSSSKCGQPRTRDEHEGRGRARVAAWRDWLGVAVALLAVVGCGRQERASQDGRPTSKPVVIAANHPLQYFAQRIGGDAIEVVFSVPADVDPAFWVPGSEEIAAMQAADLVLLNGAGYEKWLPTISLAERKLVDTSAGFRDQWIEEGAGPSHQHGPGGEHSHGEIAFTTWLDLSLASQQAKAVLDALVTRLPDEAGQLHANFTKLTQELATLDRELRSWGAALNGQPLVASHPVYQYFARRYGLNLRSVHWEPDEVPDAAARRELEGTLQEHPATLMIWEGEPAEAAVRELKARGVASVVVRPCGGAPVQGDFLSEMRLNLVRLQN
jgi:zinc transport system substrate-binding protein